jgi:hypothetical protein
MRHAFESGAALAGVRENRGKRKEENYPFAHEKKKTTLFKSIHKHALYSIAYRIVENAQNVLLM